VLSVALNGTGWFYVVHISLHWCVCVSAQMVLFENPLFGGQAYEVFRDLEDATTLQLSPVISVRVVRGW